MRYRIFHRRCMHYTTHISKCFLDFLRVEGRTFPGFNSSSKSATTCSHASCSVCSLMTMYFLPDKPRCCNNKPVRRVSSQQTTVTEPSVSMARCDMSLRLPIGVATSVSVPLMRCEPRLSRLFVRQIVRSIQMATRQLFLIDQRVLRRALA